MKTQSKPVFLVVYLVATGLLLSLTAGPAGAEPNPDRIRVEEPVTDLVGALSNQERQQLNDKLYAHHDLTGVQMAVLLVNTTGGLPIEDYSLRVAEQWEGGSTDRDDGILLTLAIAQRENRLELGYGIEPLISDRAAGQILDDAVPLLQTRRYGDAIDQITDAVIARTEHLTPASSIDRPLGQRAGLFFPFLFLFAIAYAFYWRYNRDELHDYGEIDITFSPDDPPKRSSSRSSFGLTDVLWWATPALLIVILFQGGHNFWIPYLGFWATLSFAVAWSIARFNPWGALCFVGWLFIPLAWTPLLMGANPTDSHDLFAFWEELFFVDIVLLWYGLPFLLVIAKIREDYGSPHRTYGSTGFGSGSSSGVGGGGSGGFGGGGGGFGGGGASGGW